MKSIRILLFIVCVFVLLGVGWFFMPAEGIKIGSFNLRFPPLKLLAYDHLLFD